MEDTKIVEENFKNIDPQLLLDPNRYQEVLGMVLSVDAAETCDYSKEYAILLAGKLTQIANQLDANLAEKYFKLLKVLRLGSLLSVNDGEKEKFFKELILDTFTLDFVDVKSKVDFVFRGYFASKEIIENLRTMFLRGLEKNTEILGKEQILVTVYGENRPVQPTIQNWLLDYNSSAHIDPVTHKRSGFDEVNFMTHSANANKLGKQDRETLLKIIQFYDWLKFDSLIYDFRLEGQPQWQDRFFEASTPQKLIPDDLAEVIESIRAKEANQQPRYIQAEKFELPREVLQPEQKVQPPAVPAPKSRPEQRDMEEIQKISNEDTTSPNPSSSNFAPNIAKASSGEKASSDGARRGIGTTEGEEQFLQKPTPLGQSRNETKTGVINKADTFSIPNRVNIQDILNSREKGKDGVSGLKMWDAQAGKVVNKNTTFPRIESGAGSNPSSSNFAPNFAKASSGEKATSDGARRGMETGEKNNPSQEKQKEIDRKLDELEKRVK